MALFYDSRSPAKYHNRDGIRRPPGEAGRAGLHLAAGPQPDLRGDC